MLGTANDVRSGVHWRKYFMQLNLWVTPQTACKSIIRLLWLT